ncbi:hypothetical protein QOZ80_1BG0074540 [Eleusine coracana subsp. coracana]|nr:hypothetical protein QOZ80_1BG0074540 [Eleusine coracana subsp. coracana]
METIHENEATVTASHEDSDKTGDVSISDECDPWNPPYEPCPPGPSDLDMGCHIKLVEEWMNGTEAMIADSRATHTIIPDRTPESANDAFFNILCRLEPILEKDSVRLFLRLFEQQNGCGMAWGFVITPQAFNQIVKQNALRCAKVVLEGKAPELRGHRANPNYMNQYGYGASANLRTAGPDVTENLLPLHVAVENTCLHKFLEDNLFPDQEKHLDCNQADANNIYKLIHLLCLPEMKIFLDTTRLLAEKTENLVENRRGQKKLKERRKHFSNSLMLVHIISQAGEFLDAYVQAHPEVSHVMHVAHGEVLDRVSSILKHHGFFTSEGGINIGTLCPYEHALPKLSNEELPDKQGNEVAGMHYLHPAAEKAGKKKQPRGWELKYTRKSFFPYWRSILSPRMVRIMPQMLTLEQINNIRNKSAGKGLSPISNRDLNLLERFPQLRSHQPIRAFGTTAALTVMKALKNA